MAQNPTSYKSRKSNWMLVRYRVMAFTTAVLLIVLVFLGIPLQLAAHKPEVVNVVGTMHGFLYIVYLLAAFQLTLRLRVRWWQMALVLLAGTIPFCAFVAERKMTRRYHERFGGSEPVAAPEPGVLRRRWFSGRALLLHLELAVVAPGCAVAGWWQATRALGGNALSWVYSVEWPIFALLAIGGWWVLIHEDPDVYRARRARHATEDLGEAVDAAFAEAGLETAGIASDRHTALLSSSLAVLAAFECLVGIMAVLAIPFSRPGGWIPHNGMAIYVVHVVLGLALLGGGAVLTVRMRSGSRSSFALSLMGLVGVCLAGIGGLLTVEPQAIRFLGGALMAVGALFALATYTIPGIVRLRTRPPHEPELVASPGSPPTGPPVP